MGFRFRQKLMILNDLESRVSTKWLRLESHGFRYKVALYHSYLHIKFDDKTEGNPFELQAYF